MRKFKNCSCCFGCQSQFSWLLRLEEISTWFYRNAEDKWYISTKSWKRMNACLWLQRVAFRFFTRSGTPAMKVKYLESSRGWTILVTGIQCWLTAMCWMPNSHHIALFDEPMSEVTDITWRPIASASVIISRMIGRNSEPFIEFGVTCFHLVVRPWNDKQSIIVTKYFPT